MRILAPPPPMNPKFPRAPLELVEIIDFKWQMAHEGHHVHVERLQAEPAYARECLAFAAASPSGALRETGVRLMRQLGLDDEQAPPPHEDAPGEPGPGGAALHGRTR